MRLLPSCRRHGARRHPCTSCHHLISHIACSSERVFRQPSPSRPLTRLLITSCSCHPGSCPSGREPSRGCHPAPPPLSPANWPDTPPPSKCAVRPTPHVHRRLSAPARRTHTQPHTRAKGGATKQRERSVGSVQRANRATVNQRPRWGAGRSQLCGGRIRA